MRYILFIFLFISTLWAGGVDKNIPKENVIFLSYIQKPDRVYVNQIFKVKIKAIIAINSFDKLDTAFKKAINSKVINPKNPWKKLDKHIYTNEFYIKATSKNALLPIVSVYILKNGKKIAIKSLKPFELEIIQLKKDDIFSGVVASDLKVTKSKTTKFDKKSNILVMEIEAKEANIRDFKVQNSIKDGIDSYKINLPNSKIFYFAIIPKSQKEFIFSYFNTHKNRFEKLTIPLKLLDEDTSTQLGLNPKASKISMYKNIALVVVALLSLIIFIFRRKIIYLLIFVAIAIYLYMFYNPLDTVVLQKDTKIRILPTYNSTIFHITDKKVLAEKLNSTKEYVKVLLPNDKIGWVKKGDIQ